ncbi:hypothetical protein DL93DRAFT_2073261 [Clavulina sp. PMI_390]|nr:hypothetical protein DL93DRAFT_2073261 [Clavulina sp. PMI_390]
MPIRGVFLDEYEFEPLRIVCATIPKLQIRYPFYHDLSDVCRLIAGLGAGLGYLHMHEVIHDDLQWVLNSPIIFGYLR